MEIRNGAAAGNHSNPLALPLLSSKCKFDSCDSRSKRVPAPGSYAHGASATGSGITYPSGSSRRGKCRSIQTPATEIREILAPPKTDELRARRFGHPEPVIRRRLFVHFNSSCIPASDHKLHLRPDAWHTCGMESVAIVKTVLSLACESVD